MSSGNRLHFFIIYFFISLFSMDLRLTDSYVFSIQKNQACLNLPLKYDLSSVILLLLLLIIVIIMIWILERQGLLLSLLHSATLPHGAFTPLYVACDVSGLCKQIDLVTGLL